MSKLASPSGFPKARPALTRVGQASVKRQVLHVIRLYEPRTELRCPLKASVPLARSLHSPSTSPCGSIDRQQVLRELRGLLCQSSHPRVTEISEIRHFCPIQKVLIHYFFFDGPTNQRVIRIFSTEIGPRKNPLKYPSGGRHVQQPLHQER